MLSTSSPTPSGSGWSSAASYKMFKPLAVPSLWADDEGGRDNVNPALYILLPMLVILSTLLLMLISFLIIVLFVKRRRAIRLVEDGGPLDLSKGDGVMGEGGVEGVEARWLETVDPDTREGYKRAKDYQLQYPPSSLPTDITLSQFLSIQEKGVSAWAFEPDYEDNLSLFVEQRTEIVFLADGPGMHLREGGGNSVMANLPLPKLNEVYYWEVKMYEKPATTEVAIGLATKPFPSFRLPGWNRHSIGYFASDGFKSHNFPFTASSYGPPLAEGDVLGVGYRPRTGTVFFTRNGKKMDDAYTGLQKFNLFPTVGANGACTVHVNLGQAGFVFIEANVKKWGLAPMIGTLAPPPAYGSERGSILLDAGYGTPASRSGTPLGDAAAAGRLNLNPHSHHLSTSSSSSTHSGPLHPIPNSPSRNREAQRSGQRSHRHRRAGKTASLASSIPAVPSPLRSGGAHAGPGPETEGRRRRALARESAQVEDEEASPPLSPYVSPTDTPAVEARVPPLDDSDCQHPSDSDGGDSDSNDGLSPSEHNPPTPNLLDISLHSIRQHGREPSYFGGRSRDGSGSGSGSGSGESEATVRPEQSGNVAPTQPQTSPPPPGYSPLDPVVYSQGVPTDLPAEIISQAFEAMENDARRAQNQTAPESSGPTGWLRRLRG